MVTIWIDEVDDDDDDDIVHQVSCGGFMWAAPQRLLISRFSFHLPPTNCNATSSPFHDEDYFGDNMIICKIILMGMHDKDNLAHAT